MDWIALTRPRQWTKNLLVFAGLIFSGRFDQLDALLIAILTFIAFCCVSSAGYVWNDVLDRREDAGHPEKRSRPLAAQRISIRSALLFSSVLLAIGFVIQVNASETATYVLGGYVANQLIYSLWARRYAIIDVFLIASGFIIRAVAGAVALSVAISPWLFLVTFLLALFLAFGKRRYELNSVQAGVRSSLQGYSSKLLDQLISVSAAGAVLSYCIYAIQSHTAEMHPLLVITIPFPIFGVMRYLQIIYRDEEGGHPDRSLVTDPWLFFTVVLWLVASLIAMRSNFTWWDS